MDEPAHFIYAGQADWQLIEERDGAGATATRTRDHAYGNSIDELVHSRDLTGAAAVEWFHHQDDLFSIVATTDASGAVVERFQYGDYGDRRVFDAAGNTREYSVIGLRHGFTGQIQDDESGLVLMRHRHLNPADGKWVQRDPAWYVDGSSLSAYVTSGPLVWTDPTGTNKGQGPAVFTATAICDDGNGSKCRKDIVVKNQDINEAVRQLQEKTKNCAISSLMISAHNSTAAMTIFTEDEDGELSQMTYDQFDRMIEQMQFVDGATIDLNICDGGACAWRARNNGASNTYIQYTNGTNYYWNDSDYESARPGSDFPGGVIRWFPGSWIGNYRDYGLVKSTDHELPPENGLGGSPPARFDASSVPACKDDDCE